MKERLETIITKYEELKQELTKPEVLADYNKLRTLSKERINSNLVLPFTI